MIYLIWVFNNIHVLNQAPLKIKWAKFLIRGLLFTLVHGGLGRGINHYQSKSQYLSIPNRRKYLVDMVQFGARPSSIIWLFTQPFRPNLHAAPTGLTAAGPVGPLAELAVRGAGDDAGLFDVTWVQENERRAIPLCHSSTTTQMLIWKIQVWLDSNMLMQSLHR